MRIFNEQQRFTQLWLIILLIFSAVVPVAIILKDADKMEPTNLITTLCIVILAPALLFFFKLTTRIDDKGIHYQFFPFHFSLKTIAWQDIKSAHVRTYDAIGEFGGWGLKGGLFWKKSKGTAINVSGDIGIQLELKNGKKLLIGTKKEEESKRVLSTYASKLNNN